MMEPRNTMETEKKLRSLQREPGPGARRDLTLGTIYYKGYKMISPRVGSSKTGDVPPGSSLAVCPHQATGENLYSRIVRAWRVSLVTPVAYLGVA